MVPDRRYGARDAERIKAADTASKPTGEKDRGA
jgi:hypothetical protein